MSVLDADAVLPRMIPVGSLEQIIYRVDALHWIEARGVTVMNSPRAIERTVDKFYTTALLHEAGLPTPETVVCERAADAMPAVLRLGDVVIKPLFGSMGHGIVRVSDPDMAFRVITTLESLRAVFYVQRAVDHGGRDVRAFVIGGRVVGAIERRAPYGEWRTNVTLGGAAVPFELPPTWEQLALRAAEIVNAEYAGVDLLPARDGEVFVLEVNGIPGWQGLSQATGIDVAGAIVDRLESSARARTRSGRIGVHEPSIGCRRHEVAAAAQLACLLEVSAAKPGNVTPDHRFEDAGTRIFSPARPRSARRSRKPARDPLGATVRLAIEATRHWTRSNTNLGIVLLLAPLARAAIVDRGVSAWRDGVRRVLDDSTVADARDVYRAIRRAAPGGLGRVDDQDVGAEPSVTLLDAMRLAAARDGIAREYNTGFEVTFETGAPALLRARGEGLAWGDAVVETFLTLLARTPDTHVVRRSGLDEGRDDLASRRAP